jgi:hypothetical protein
MAGEAGLLECPMCDFTVLPVDDYILQLHFEQVHTYTNKTTCLRRRRHAFL